MTADMDMSQYMSIFLDEAEEQLQILDESLVKLEDRREDPELINKIFRAAHTLKGSSASMDFKQTATLTHAMENVLDLVRQQALTVTTELVDVLLEALDLLRQLIAEVADSGSESADISATVARLQRIQPAAGGEAGPQAADKAAAAATSPILQLNDIEENLVRAAEIKGYRVWHIRVELEKDCLMKGPRAYIVFKSLEEVGEVIKTVPGVEDIEAEKFELSFELLLVSREDADHVGNIIKSTSEIASVQIAPVTLDQEAESRLGAASLQAQPGASPGASAESDEAAKRLNQTVRVDVRRLDVLLNLVGELVIDRTRLAEAENGLRANANAQDLLDALEEISTHIGRVTSDLQEEIMRARMFPIDQVFNRFPRMVRDLAHKAGKEVNFVIEGRETELDRTVIEEIGDPLIHLLRNAIDHGIETPEERARAGKPARGTIELKAFHQENQIVITIADDGRGMEAQLLRQKVVEKGLLSAEAAGRLDDREALNLIFMPGFSTSAAVSDVSGRGVGMDIVRSHLERINGLIETHTTPGRGAKFTIKLPLTLAINRSLLVTVAGRIMAFPLSNVVEIVQVETGTVQRIHQQDAVLLRGQILPLVELAEVLRIDSPPERKKTLPVVVAGISEKRVGFIVDDFIGEQEIVIKSLGDYIGQIHGLAGATIMGNGQVALILDVRSLLDQAEAKARRELAS
ncbi:MAG: chemotaxis protein CheA [Clostridia bacterium]|nr:MAG: chemotaxis protein CheA [Clostridia bacterium]